MQYVTGIFPENQKNSIIPGWRVTQAELLNIQPEPITYSLNEKKKYITDTFVVKEVDFTINICVVWTEYVAHKAGSDWEAILLSETDTAAWFKKIINKSTLYRKLRKQNFRSNVK